MKVAAFRSQQKKWLKIRGADNNIFIPSWFCSRSLLVRKQTVHRRASRMKGPEKPWRKDCERLLLLSLFVKFLKGKDGGGWRHWVNYNCSTGVVQYECLLICRVSTFAVYTQRVHRVFVWLRWRKQDHNPLSQMLLYVCNIEFNPYIHRVDNHL